MSQCVAIIVDNFLRVLAITLLNTNLPTTTLTEHMQLWVHMHNTRVKISMLDLFIFHLKVLVSCAFISCCPTGAYQSVAQILWRKWVKFYFSLPLLTTFHSSSCLSINSRETVTLQLPVLHIVMPFTSTNTCETESHRLQVTLFQKSIKQAPNCKTLACYSHGQFSPYYYSFIVVRSMIYN